MSDPTVHVRRALRHLQQRTAMRAEIVMLRRELAEARAENGVLRMLLGLGRYARIPEPALPPLRVTPVQIPSPRPTPEGVRHAHPARAPRRRPR